MLITRSSIFIILLILNNAKGQRRIFGGHEPKQGQIPYAVFVEIKNIGACTGSIIHSEWVLSAAHCVSNANHDIVRPNKINIIAGIISSMTWTKGQQSRLAKKIFRHEKYKPETVGRHDVSVIQVEKPFQFTKYIQKIDFMTSPWPQDDGQQQKNCVAAGWGISEDGDTKKINYLNTTAKHGRKACPCIHKFYKLKTIVCLPNIADEGICSGDSGGALVCDGKIVGVAHVVLDKRSCSYFKTPHEKINCGDKEVYGIYIYTCPYLDWISDKVPGIPSKPASCKGITTYTPSKILEIFINIILPILLNTLYKDN